MFCRRVLPFLAAGVVLAGLASAADASAAGPPQRDLTVMSFNIHHGGGTDGVVDLDRIASVVRANHVDVVAMQEVDRHYSARSGWADEPAELAKALDYHVVFAANIDQDPPAPGKPRVQYGTAILSRYPIVHWSNTLLFRSPDQEQRGLLRADIEVQSVRVSVFDTHLEAYSTIDRQTQALQVADLVADARPSILMGDLNAEPDAPELQPLFGALTDAWPAAGTGPELTYPAEGPVKRIDYVLTGPGAQPRQCTVVTTNPVASDHLPMACQVTVSR
ncbi:endonuclease/exonuclease/phosphatase family protein [Labedaea rhizosphaerae]|uniref:Endonuclease/exonuclease/phosphatase family metal-dependent hydrolase n=1 Tax=Labedaea rhizosphaerae TaxID=598644 RepID=A0A4R6SIW4_LABRH|nr:endonuclease/exonuclease/phosphatase family protein [Labedaea rhizosphaerae]TDQ00938.1 endonuclease/exonuclease/phosphatase family metal-dependent hydrolase [Labedaea rhizosphaerae]